MLLLESEGTRHTTTTRIYFGDFKVSPLKNGHSRSRTHHRFLMTVAVKQRATRPFLKIQRQAIGSFLQEKLFEQEARLSHRLRVIAPEQFHPLISQGEQT